MTSPSPKQLLGLTLFWVIIFAATFAGNQPSLIALLVRFRKNEALATITKEADPTNHLYLTYQYAVDGTTFTGQEYGPDRKELRLGERTHVSYFLAHPQFATIGSDIDQTRNLKEGVMVGIFLATLLTLAVYWKYFRAT